MKEQLERARELFFRIYGSRLHYAPEVARAPQGSQLGDWREGLAQLDAVISALSDAENPLCNAEGLWHPGVFSEDQTERRVRCSLPRNHEGKHAYPEEEEERRKALERDKRFEEYW